MLHGLAEVGQLGIAVSEGGLQFRNAGIGRGGGEVHEATPSGGQDQPIRALVAETVVVLNDTWNLEFQKQENIFILELLKCMYRK